jgi:hypothetical protein
MGTTSMAQLQDVMISSSQRIWDAPDFPVRRDFWVKMGMDARGRFAGFQKVVGRQGERYYPYLKR